MATVKKSKKRIIVPIAIVLVIAIIVTSIFIVRKVNGGEQVTLHTISTGDIYDGWPNIKMLAQKEMQEMEYNGCGCFNDMDMLVVGMDGAGNVGMGGCTFEEYRTHFTLWAMLNSPLMIGCDIREMSDETRRILMNDEMIRINQDPLCRQPYKVKNHAWNDNVLIYVKALANGNLAIGMFNLSDEKSRAAMNLDEIGLPFSTGRTLELTEVWTCENLCANNASLVTELEPFASKVYRAKVVKL